MKSFFLILTILFSFSVAADCCNFEIDFGSDSIASAEHTETDCDKNVPSENHCHCTTTNHVKIHTVSEYSFSSPVSIQLSTFPITDQQLFSTYEDSIFHPPIA